MLKSKLTKYQKLKFTKNITYYGKPCTITVKICYDDDCNNGHNTFTIIGFINTKRARNIVGGCIHDEIAKYFPEFRHLIKWHLCGSQEPLYYYENTLYFARTQEFDKARRSAIWFDATDEQLSLPTEELKKLLKRRLPTLMKQFKTDVENLGFIY